MSMIVNRRDIDFMFYEALGLDQMLQSERYADYDRDSLALRIESFKFTTS